MKKVMLMIVAALTLTVSASAQNNDNQQAQRQRPSKTEMIQKQTDRMAERYGLSKEQAQQLLQVNTTYGDKFMHMGGPRGPRMRGQGQRPERRDSVAHQRPSKEQMEAMRKEMTTQMKAYKTAVKKIMTDEQFAKYEADLKNFRPGRKPGEKQSDK